MTITGRRMPQEPAHATPDSAQVKPSFRGFIDAVRLKQRGVLSSTYASDYITDRSAQVTKSAMGETSGSVGGYLVPTDYSLKVHEIISEESFILPRANVIPMASSQMLAPKIDDETVPGATGQSPFFGGIVFSWGFSQAPTETEPKFRGMMLNAWDLIGYCIVSNQFFMDSGPGGDEYLFRLFGRAAAWYAEYAFLQGTGVDSKMPLGVLNAPAAISVTRQVAGQINIADVAGLAGKLLPFSWNQSIWACSPTALPQIMQLPTYLVNGEVRSQPGAVTSLMTRPLFVTEKLPPLGTRGDLILFDPSLYTVGMRQEVLVDASDQVLFQTYQTMFRIWMRLDGRPQLGSTVTLQDTSTVVSSIAVLT